MWAKRKHEELKKNEFLNSCHSGKFVNLHFTDEDEIKCHVQEVHPNEHVSLDVYTCLKVGRRALGPLLDAKQAATNFVVSNVKRSSNGVFFLSVFVFRTNQFLRNDILGTSQMLAMANKIETAPIPVCTVQSNSLVTS